MSRAGPSDLTDSLVDFSSLQPVESALLAGMSAITDALARVDWLVECAPVTSPSPQLSSPVQRERVLFSQHRFIWPFVSAFDALPVDTDSVPLVVIRHAWQPGLAGFALAEWVRVLKPGGTLIALSANPWHPKVWPLVKRQTLKLPSWPHFLWANSHPEMKLSLNPFCRADRRWPRLSPVLVVVGQKRSPVAPIRPMTRRSLSVKQAPAMLTQCRAA